MRHKPYIFLLLRILLNYLFLRAPDSYAAIGYAALAIILALDSFLPELSDSRGFVLSFLVSGMEHLMNTSRRELRLNGYTSDISLLTRIAIVGTREPSLGYADILRDISSFIGQEDVVIVTGGARGVDTYGIWFAKEHSLPCDIYWPLWDELGKRAGFVRNNDIVVNSDIVLAWPGIGGRGTQLTVKLANDQNVPCIEVPIRRIS